VEQAYTRYALRVDPTLPQDDMMPPLDDPAIELGSIYRSSAVASDAEPEGPLDDPHARTWAVGTRVPHTQLDGGMSTLDVVDGGFAVLASEGADEWRQAASEAAESLGVQIAVQPVDASIPDGAALLRPDAVIAWRPEQPAAEAAGRLPDVMATLLSR
jgi:hypothetical protein